MNRITPVGIGIIIDKRYAFIPDQNRISAFPPDSPLRKNKVADYHFYTQGFFMYSNKDKKGLVLNVENCEKNLKLLYDMPPEHILKNNSVQDIKGEIEKHFRFTQKTFFGKMFDKDKKRKGLFQPEFLRDISDINVNSTCFSSLEKHLNENYSIN